MYIYTIYIYQNNIPIILPYVHPNLHHFVTNNHRNKRPTRFWGRRGQVPWMTFAKPMSVSFTRPLSVSSRFSGFKSRKTILVSSCREIELRYVVRKDATLISIYLYIYIILYIYIWYTIVIGYIEYIYIYIIHIYIYIKHTFKKRYTCGGWFGMLNDTDNYTANRVCLFTSPFAIKKIWL